MITIKAPLASSVHIRDSSPTEVFDTSNALRHRKNTTMKVFVSYRREDSRHIVDRISDRLKSTLGPDSVFKDVDSIPLGVDFRQSIELSVGHGDQGQSRTQAVARSLRSRVAGSLPGVGARQQSAKRIGQVPGKGWIEQRLIKYPDNFIFGQ